MTSENDKVPVRASVHAQTRVRLSARRSVPVFVRVCVRACVCLSVCLLHILQARQGHLWSLSAASFVICNQLIVAAAVKCDVPDSELP